MRYDIIVEVEKFNPYHDARGRFTSPGNATSFTYRPGKSKAHDNAIERERKRTTDTVKNRGVTMGEPGTGMQITSGKSAKGSIYFVSNGQYRNYHKTYEVLPDKIVRKLIKDGNARFLKKDEMDSLKNASNEWNSEKPDYELGVNGQRGKGKTIHRYRR